jgi:type VI secretion system protein ImpJ
MMEPLRPIFWGQGMFLQPQHFQQQDVYHEARLRRYLQLLHPFCWGIHTLAINETALQTFVFEVEQCEWVTWEGTILRFQAESIPSNARIMPRSFESDLSTDGGPFGIYLGLKRLQWEERNVDSGQTSGVETATGAHRRFRLQESLTPDLLAADDNQSCSLHYLMHDVRILFDGDAALQNQEYELLKIAELLRAPDGRGAILSKRYIPPALNLQASSVLEGMIKEIRDLLTAKGRELAEYRRPLGGSKGELGGREALSLLMLQLVNRYIPLFHHHLEVRETHPCEFYVLLRQFIGEFSTFSNTVSVLGGPLPPYRHDRLWECFDAAVRVAKQLLSGVETGPEYVVPLVYDNREYFSADLEPRVFQRGNRCYLSVKVDLPPQDLERLLTVEGKIASREDMSMLRERFLPGIKLQYLRNPPDDLPQRPQFSYFALNQNGTLWEHIAQRQNIAVYCQLPDRDTEMQLLVLF